MTSKQFNRSIPTASHFNCTCAERKECGSALRVPSLCHVISQSEHIAFVFSGLNLSHRKIKRTGWNCWIFMFQWQYVFIHITLFIAFIVTNFTYNIFGEFSYFLFVIYYDQAGIHLIKLKCHFWHFKHQLWHLKPRNMGILQASLRAF